MQWAGADPLAPVAGRCAVPNVDSVRWLRYVWRTNSTLFTRLDKRNTTATTDV
jgi:hypothetical protein